MSATASFTFNAAADRDLVANFAVVGTSRIISVSAAPLLGGNVTGGGTVADGGNVTVTATANADYTFTNWTEGGAAVSASASYTFVATCEPHTRRELHQHGRWRRSALIIVVSASPPDGGVVEADAPSYEEGDGADVQAQANPGYTFVNWTENGVEVSTDWKYDFTIMNSRTLVANFMLIPATGFHVTENENEMEFEWPETAAGWVLQESTDLSTWVNSTRRSTSAEVKNAPASAL